MENLLWLVAWHGAALTGALAWCGLKSLLAWERPAREYYSNHNLGVWTGLGVKNG